MSCLITFVSTHDMERETDDVDQETLDEFLDFVFEVLAAAVSQFSEIFQCNYMR